MKAELPPEDLENESGAGKIVQQSCFIQTEMERSGILQSALILWDPVHLRRGGGGGGGGHGEVGFTYDVLCD